MPAIKWNVFASLILLFIFMRTTAALAQTGFPAQIKNIVIIVQENRTPDNLFQGLSPKCPQSSTTCRATSITSSCYDISNCGLSNQSGTGTGTDQPITFNHIALAGTYDPSHSHQAFVNMCDLNLSTGVCAMDRAWKVGNTTNTPNGSYAYVANSTGALDPYLQLAQSYGWANFMFQTNQGPSYPAHQFLFSGTSALSAVGDAESKFMAGNLGANAGCLTPSGMTDNKIVPNPGGTINFSSCTYYYGNTVQSCGITNVLTGSVGSFCVPPGDTEGHDSMADLLDPAGITWKYYTPNKGSIWTAPNALQSLCVPAFDSAGNLFCSGSEWKTNVDAANLGTDILTDIANCKLSNVSWVIPNGIWSDHAAINIAGQPPSSGNLGPSWVAAVVNAIGTQATCASNTPDAGQNFWENTAIIVTWDDWGGWSDHEPPPILSPGPPCTSTDCPGDYQLGFRVPLIVVSAYTPAGYIDNTVHDFGSILRMIEDLNGLGRLGFADSRATTDLANFFSMTTPRSFSQITGVLEPGSYFTGQAAAGATAVDPDDDNE
jgi:phospholipase C